MIEAEELKNLFQQEIIGGGAPAPWPPRGYGTVNAISPAVGPREGVALGVGARVVTPGGIAARGVKLQEPCVNMMSSIAISPLKLEPLTASNMI